MISFHQLGSMGRLGNQLFEFVTTLAVASKNKYDCKFNFNHKLCSIHKVFNLEHLSINHDKVPKRVWYEKEYGSHDHIWNSPDNVVLMGYLQSYKYVQYFNKEYLLSQYLQFKPDIVDRCKNSLDPCKKYVALHVRRTDYLSHYFLYHQLSLPYYKTAIDMTDSTYAVIVFSDDIKWCKTHIPKICTRELLFSENNTGEDLYLMSLCNQHIIANSTFSWWGAYLSSSEKVICPRFWFKKSDIYMKESEIIIPEWTIL